MKLGDLVLIKTVNEVLAHDGEMGRITRVRDNSDRKYGVQFKYGTTGSYCENELQKITMRYGNKLAYQKDIEYLEELLRRLKKRYGAKFRKYLKSVSTQSGDKVR